MSLNGSGSHVYKSHWKGIARKAQSDRSDLLTALYRAREALMFAIKANWEGATDADVAKNLVIKQIDSAIAKAIR